MSDPNPSTQEVSQTPRILLVDDEPGLRTAVQAYLEDEGFQVTTAVDGEEGWEKAQKMIPDVIISDVMMPRCDGYGLLKKIREDERLGGTLVKINLLGSIFKYEAIFSRDTSTAAEAKTPDRLFVLEGLPHNSFQ